MCGDADMLCSGRPRLRTESSHCSRAVDALVALSLSDGDEAVVNMLVATGELVDTRDSNLRSEVALCLASSRGDVGLATEILRSGVEVNCAPSFGGMTPLMFATRFEHLGVLETLLQHPCISLHATSNEGQTALSLCRGVATRRLAAHAMIERSGDCGRYIFVQAACLGHVSALQSLLDAKVEPDQCDERGRTALLVGALRHHSDVCELLLARGADPTRTDISGMSACSAAAGGSHEKLRTMLQLYAAAQ